MSFSAIRWAWECQCPSSTAKTVLLFLADCLNEGSGQCNPSLDRIRAYTQYSLPAVRKAINDLKDKEIISYGREDGTFSFHLNFTYSGRVRVRNRHQEERDRKRG